MKKITSKNSCKYSHRQNLSLLMNDAKKIRNEYYGKSITFSRKVFVPLTNICRNQCGYCTFVQEPNSPNAKILSPKEVLKIAFDGQRNGCKEVLFSLGEKPELKHPNVKNKLELLGHDNIVDYLVEMCELVINETDLLPHTNIGTLSRDEIEKLKPVTASMGMMLETTSKKLFHKGGAHYKCPDKVPSARLKTIQIAGEMKVPFTTGILIGIGETWDDRIESLIAINDMYKKYGHIQEVIIQNFKAKREIPMANSPEPSIEDMLKTIALARVILNPKISIQAPPNLSETYLDYLEAGINDWGGISPVTKDHINPEREWPQIDFLKQSLKNIGYSLSERLTVYPKFQSFEKQFVSKKISNKINMVSRRDGLALNQVFKELI